MPLSVLVIIFLSLSSAKLAFGLITITTMTSFVFLATEGLMALRVGFLEKYIHAFAGAILAICGISIRLFGL